MSIRINEFAKINLCRKHRKCVRFYRIFIIMFCNETLIFNERKKMKYDLKIRHYFILFRDI